MVWFSDTWKWYSKTAITRKKNELIKSLEISTDDYCLMFFEDAYTLFKEIEKYHYSSVFWRFCIEFYHYSNIEFMTKVKNTPDWKNFSKEEKLRGFRNHISSLKAPFKLPVELVYELENKSNALSDYFIKTQTNKKAVIIKT